jgi:ribosomal protein S18 acetylase RimI-like enzyme
VGGWVGWAVLLFTDAMSTSSQSGFATYQPDAPGERQDTPPVTIREPTIAELADCAAMIVSRTGGDPDARRERLAGYLADDDHCLLVAVVDSEVAGFGQVMPFSAGLSAADIAPDGYYLIALFVAPSWRRRGIGEQLTRARMAWAARRADTIWYFANAANGATLDLHRRLGFVEVSRRFTFPGVTFAGGTGVLLRAALPGQQPS